MNFYKNFKTHLPASKEIKLLFAKVKVVLILKRYRFPSTNQPISFSAEKE